MQNKILFFILVIVTLNLTVTLDYQLGRDCSTKAILDGNSQLIYNGYADHKSAFNGISSCASLRSSSNTACCYKKVKFKNAQAGNKYTQRGCIEVKGEEWNNIKDLINNLEANITHPNITAEKQDVDIDCHSTLIKLTGLVLLAFLL